MEPGIRGSQDLTTERGTFEKDNIEIFRPPADQRSDWLAADIGFFSDDFPGDACRLRCPVPFSLRLNIISAAAYTIPLQLAVATIHRHEGCLIGHTILAVG